MRPSRLFARVFFGIGLALILGLAFVGYLRPSFIVDLANRIALCM